MQLLKNIQSLTIKPFKTKLLKIFIVLNILSIVTIVSIVLINASIETNNAIDFIDYVLQNKTAFGYIVTLIIALCLSNKAITKKFFNLALIVNVVIGLLAICVILEYFLYYS